MSVDVVSHNSGREIVVIVKVDIDDIVIVIVCVNMYTVPIKEEISNKKEGLVLAIIHEFYL